ncbi:MAG: glycerol-3-phosphate 1-O-acyltransferase PlsY [Oscillospiraceae bacterium]|nr:glycerol-3-phosphate 1-O-acyltransferase PlsY [Oscillospiraceae bacterium]
MNSFVELISKGYIREQIVSAGGGIWSIVLAEALCAIIGYLFGSINTALIVSRAFYGSDVREYGSGNAGMTNMFRTYGSKAGVFTLLGDMAKAAIGVFIAMLLMGQPAGYIAGLACMIGHTFPVFFGFRGGKGVVVAATTILVVDPPVFLCVIAIFIGAVMITKIMSVGSITAAFFFPMIQYAFHIQRPYFPTVVCSILMCCFVIAAHRPNIQRLLKKEEKQFSFRSRPLITANADVLEPVRQDKAVGPYNSGISVGTAPKSYPARTGIKDPNSSKKKNKKSKMKKNKKDGKKF